MRRYISSAEFRKSPDRDAIVKKSGLAIAPAVVADRTLRFVISNENQDRSGDIIKLDGWKLTNYHKNPIVLFEHNASWPPVGRCIEIGVVGKNLEAVVEFLPAEVPTFGEFADGIFQMCTQGFLSATSVGFRVIDFDRGDDGTIFKEQELCEFSIVTIPDNPTALIVPPSDGAKSLSNINNQQARRERDLTILRMKILGTDYAEYPRN